MRRKLLKILRGLEKDDGFRSTRLEYDENYACDFLFDDYYDFPNYKFLIKKFNDDYPSKSKSGVVIQSAANGIKAELRRMELDGLVMIGEQKGVSQVSSKTGPDFDNVDVKSESVILTTIGRSVWKYYAYEAIKSPLSWVAIIISLIALFK
jgi:hypothetical protein